MRNQKNQIIFWGMGFLLFMQVKNNSRCLITLALITGHIGRPGTGLHPLEGKITYKVHQMWFNSWFS